MLKLFIRHLDKTIIVPFFLGLFVSVSALAFDYPLSTNAIRDAYFLGRHNMGTGTVFLPQYSRTIPNLAVEPYVSRVRVETPFFQVAEHASATSNYSAQDAVTDFYGKPVKLRIYLEVCYRIDAPLPSAVKIRVLQQKKEIPALSDERTTFFPPSDVYGRPLNLGEKVTLEFDPTKFDSSVLTVQVDTPAGQQAQVEFEMEILR